MQRLEEIFPAGIMRCTVEKYPQITFMNDTMKSIIRSDRADHHWSGLIEHNFYFLIPHGDRKRLDLTLQAAAKNGEAIPLEHGIIDAEGIHVPLSGWVRLTETEDGKQEYTFLYFEKNRMEQRLQDGQERSYISALESAYNLIFMIDLKAMTVRCTHGKDTSAIGNTYYAEMTVDSAITYWGDRYVHEEDRKITKDFFTRISTKGFLQRENRPMQAEFRIVMEDGQVYYYLAVAVLMNEDKVMLCCRDTTPVIYSAHPSRENRHIFIRTFGYFDIFVDGKPVFFSSAKEKELLALLVDRNGGTLTGSQAIAYLWEDLPCDERTLARYRKLAMNMTRSLKNYGIDGIIDNKHGTRSIRTEAVECDYYGYLRGDPKYVKAFNDSYMSDYSWAEETLGKLMKIADF